MSDLLETSMIVRNLTGDPPDLAYVSAEVIGVAELLFTDFVIVETA